MLRRHDFEPVATFERFAHPEVHHELTGFCFLLTRITPRLVGGPPPPPPIH
jgi:inhibitor of KinA sporulation pathway (predicted exonuclease)